MRRLSCRDSDSWSHKPEWFHESEMERVPGICICESFRLHFDVFPHLSSTGVRQWSQPQERKHVVSYAEVQHTFRASRYRAFGWFYKVLWSQDKRQGNKGPHLKERTFFIGCWVLFVNLEKKKHTTNITLLICQGIYCILLSKTVTLYNKLCTPLDVVETSRCKALKAQDDDKHIYIYIQSKTGKETERKVCPFLQKACALFPVGVVRTSEHHAGCGVRGLLGGCGAKSSLCGKSLIIVITDGDILSLWFCFSLHHILQKSAKR